MENTVKFISTTQAKYDALVSKDAGSLYFTSDTHRIYKGSELFSISDVTNLATKSDATLTTRGLSDWSILHTPLTAEQKAAFYDVDATAAEDDYAVTIRDNSLFVGGYYAANVTISGDGLSATYAEGGATATGIWGPAGTVVATRTALQGYQLGDQ